MTQVPVDIGQDKFMAVLCETSDKTVCSVCNDWYSQCAHIIGHEYKNIVYYFYIEDRKEQITEDINDLGAIRNNENNEYHQDNKIYAVVEIETNNVNDFISAWDSIGIYKEENDGVYEDRKKRTLGKLVLQQDSWIILILT